MNMKQKRDRRRFPRWRTWGWLSGWMGDGTKVSVTNVSRSGVQVEHGCMVQPGTACFLTLALRGEKVRVKCRVVRSGVYRWETWSTGERNYVYRTGLEWLDPSEAAQHLIRGYVTFLEGEARRYQNRSHRIA